MAEIHELPCQEPQFLLQFAVRCLGERLSRLNCAARQYQNLLAAKCRCRLSGKQHNIGCIDWQD
jgi:hypothetical protein